MANNESKIDVRTAEKVIISTAEACVLFSIGMNKMLQLIQNNPRAPWLLTNGSHYRIKRAAFEKWILSQDSI